MLGTAREREEALIEVRARHERRAQGPDQAVPRAGIIVGPGHEFFVPEYLMEELNEHLDVVEEKSGLSREEINSVVRALLRRIQVVPEPKVLTKWKEAEAAIGRIDKDGVPFVAAAMSMACDGIWSDDRHLKRQGKVRVWTTKDVAGLTSRA